MAAQHDSVTEPTCHHVLLVEDSAAEAMLMALAVRDTGLPVVLHLAEDGEQALQFLRREDGYRDAPQPELVLLDINLPRLNGHEVLCAIKQDATLRHVPVLMLSNSQREWDVKASYDGHANGYLVKPTDLDGVMALARHISQFWFAVVQLPHP